MHKIRPGQPAGTQRVRLVRLPLAAAICLVVAPPAFTQDAGQSQKPAAAQTTKASAKTLKTVTVTAQKRVENLQKVPISMTVLGEDQLQKLHIKSFNDYVNYLPSVSYQPAGSGPGYSLIYMRGVVSGGDGNASGSEPSVGVYLDDEPVTTIRGPLDIHMYDIARVEALAGPQGTLYGASAESGALRIITNKPDPSGFAASYSTGIDSVDHGGIGNVVEGMINVPMSSSAAIRLVGWHEHDAGYINNAVGSRTYPSSGITISNAKGCTQTPTLVCTGTARKNYNDVDTSGGRAALKFNLNDDWSISPTIMGQQAIAHGAIGSDPQVGSLALTHFYPEYTNDRWIQAALTVQGKIGNFDLSYTYSHLRRNQDGQNDYTDYSFWYDTLFGSGEFLHDNAGNLINPSQIVQDRDRYTKNSHELRIASPKDDRLRVVGGLFLQKQMHDLHASFKVNGLADSLSIPGSPDTLWLTDERRIDKDEALFGEMSYDFIPDTLTGTIGGRYFHTANSLGGFYGFSTGYSPNSSHGEAGCISPNPYRGAPCMDFTKDTRQTGSLGKANLTWQITPDKMIYGTWSEGFRPGGVNRNGSLPPYKADYLTNYELGWKTSWLGNRLSFNGAVFHELWKNFQFTILGANVLPQIQNAGQATIDGLETNLDWQATYNLELSAGFALYDARLGQNYCGYTDSSGNPITYCPAGTVNPKGVIVTGPEAPKGTELPVTPRFKSNLTARYEWSVADYDAFVQASVVHVGTRQSALPLSDNALLGEMPAYTTADFSVGIQKNGMSLNFYINNAFDQDGQIFRYAECGNTCATHNVVPAYPNGQIYTVMTPPRTFGIRFSQQF